ncbi:hypothetical protein [Parathalassolituus penaei]|uniref:Uncharacterized protein n=1 Tax=Parathalassolituus penaei TaxID=2997323 RepID=A0A9X3EE00_9GAMM|nr:hypothetical protein [Parathalassolituus penaei]MCY0965456.1 hypothetical protein [Parathalassolituus penaei]
MTRQKKTRSLKRIHSVKTGSRSKMKREANFDRQTGKRVKNRVPSVYEKFLAENPEVRDQEVARETARQRKQEEAAVATPVNAPEEVAAVRTKEREKTLLEQLETKDFKDIY